LEAWIVNIQEPASGKNHHHTASSQEEEEGQKSIHEKDIVHKEAAPTFSQAHSHNNGPLSWQLYLFIHVGKAVLTESSLTVTV
jgi:hypothetical protein